MKRHSKNFLAIIGSDIVRRVLGFFTIAFLARKVGVGGFGVINIGYTVLSYALVVSSAGLGSYGLRAIARGESSGLVNTIITIRLISSFGAFILVSLAAVFFISNDTIALMMILFCITLFPQAFFLDWYYQGKEQMGIVGAGRMLSAIIYLLLILGFVRSASDILWVAAAAIGGEIAASCIMWFYYRRISSGSRLMFSLFGWRSLIEQALPLGGGSILSTISINLPILVIGIILTNSDAGIFSAANKLVFFLLMLDRVFGALLIPASARLHNQSPELLSSTLKLALKWILITTLPICVGGTILADKIVLTVFGMQYTSAIDIFRILIWFFFFTMLHTIYISGLLAIGQEKAYASVMIISVIIYGVSTIVCTKLFGVAGTAAAMIVSEAATLIFMRRQLQRSISIPLPEPIVQIILSVIVMGVAVGVLPSMNVFLSILFGALFYGVLLFAIKAITIEEVLNLLKRI